MLSAITTENDGDSGTGASTPIVIEVAPSPEATITGSTTAPEDTLVPVNFSIVHQHGDTDEVLSSLWIKASDVEGKASPLLRQFHGDHPGRCRRRLDARSRARRRLL